METLLAASVSPFSSPGRNWDCPKERSNHSQLSPAIKTFWKLKRCRAIAHHSTSPQAHPVGFPVFGHILAAPFVGPQRVGLYPLDQKVYSNLIWANIFSHESHEIHCFMMCFWPREAPELQETETAVSLAETARFAKTLQWTQNISRSKYPKGRADLTLSQTKRTAKGEAGRKKS